MLSCMRLHHLIMFLLIIALYFYAKILLFHSYCCREHFVSLALNNLWPPESVLQRCPLLHDVNKSSVLRFPSVPLHVRPYHIPLVKRYQESIKHERCFGGDDNFHHVAFKTFMFQHPLYDVYYLLQLYSHNCFKSHSVDVLYKKISDLFSPVILF